MTMPLDQEPQQSSLASQVRSLAERLRSSRTRLPSARTIESLRAAAELLRDERHPLTRTLKRDLRQSTGLSAPMIEWALDSTLGSVQTSVLRELAVAARTSTYCERVPARLVAVILAGNVFTSAARAIFLPLLAGAPVLVKTSRRDGAFARALKAALDRVDPAQGARLEVVSFSRDDSGATSALLAEADVVSAYGDDASLQAIAQQVRGGVRVIRHGHGLSAAYVAADQLSSLRRARDVADRVALDVAAYDQRGCLSPHAVFVETGATIRPDEFATLLAEESLPLLSELLPRGSLTASEQAGALQWRAVAAVRGRLLAAQSYAVSVEQGPVRPSPGGRQIGIYACSGSANLTDQLGPFEPHLKCVGVAASDAESRALASALRPLGARLCRIGAMQTPAFDVDADGHAPLAGLLDFRDMR